MRQHTLHALVVAGVLLVAGCAGGLSGTPESATTDASQVSDSPTGAPTVGGSVAFYISDEQNAMGDFQHLNVTVTRVGFERAAEDKGGWVEHDVDNATVDLTALQGPNATLIGEYNLSNGTYSTVFVHVGNVNATLQNGEEVRVKLPSEKLQIQQPFTVDNGSTVDFVFDITVHKAGKSGKYILKPVIGESGTDVPIEPTEDDEREDELQATFLGNVTRGDNATIDVKRGGEPVANATVLVNGNTVEPTDADGRTTFEVPDADEVAIEVTAGDAETELEAEFETDEADSEADTADDELTATFVGTVSQNATVSVMRGGNPVENATVVVNDEPVGTTGVDGQRTFEVPDAESLTVTVQVGDEEIELERGLEPSEG